MRQMRQIERDRQIEIDRDRQRQIEIDIDRQRQIEINRDRQRQIEIDRDRQRQVEIDRDRQRQIEIDSQIDRQMDRQIDRQMDRQIDRCNIQYIGIYEANFSATESVAFTEVSRWESRTWPMASTRRSMDDSPAQAAFTTSE